MVGTGSPVSFRRRPPLALRGGPDCQSSATVVTPVWAHVSAWGPARHDNHEGQRMTPGAPTDGARSRFPGHRGSTEAGTTLKDSGQSTWASKDVFCVSPLIHEAGAGFRGSSPCPALRLPVIRNDPCGAEIAHPCCWQVPLASASAHLLSSCADTLSLVRTLTRYSARGRPCPHSD